MEGNLYTIAFYNLENLFDIQNDPHTLDDDFTEDGMRSWSGARLQNKLQKLAKTISQLGTESAGDVPVIIGVAEVENVAVLKELLAKEPLHSVPYRLIHYDSPDERGIDTAFIYHADHFEVLFSKPLPLNVKNPDGRKDATRDILYVHGKLHGEEMHIFVNHWPSRRDGDVETEYKRLHAVKTIEEFMNSIEKKVEKPNYIVMGDFNDGPESASIRLLVRLKNLYNPMHKLLTPDRGSAHYGKTWALFDQIMISESLLKIRKASHSFAHANIFDDKFLTEYKGRYAGNPFRTFGGTKYLGGYSDHFPVYIQFRYGT